MFDLFCSWSTLETISVHQWVQNKIDETKHQIILYFENIHFFSFSGHVVMGTQTTSPYQQLIEKTKALSFRSQMLQLNVEKKKKAQDQPNWGTDGF